MALPAAVLVAATAVAFFSAERTLRRSAAITSTDHQLAFTLRPLDLSQSRAANPGFEPVASANSFRAGSYLDGALYLAGPAGLTLPGSGQILRTGFELPVEPIVALASARLRNASDDQLLIATAGAGLLLLSPNSHGQPELHQLLPASPDARDLTALLPLPSGDLLLGTRHAGVLLFNGSTLVPLPAADAREITALAAVDTASITIGTRNNGLFYLHAGTLEHASTATGLPDNQVEALLAVRGKLFAATPLGVAQFAATGALHLERTLAPGVFSHTLALVGPDLLIGSLDQGIATQPLNTRGRIRNAAFTQDSPAPTQRVDQFLPAPSAAAPVYALADGQLLEHSGATWNPALAAPMPALADRNISALAFAPDGTLFVGFFDHGLDQLSPTGTIRHVEDDSLFCINRLVLDPARQTLAAATANGLVLFDRQGNPRQVLTRRDGLISEHITDLAFTPAGMTVATPAGLTFFTSTGAESLYAFQGLVNNHVYTVAATPDGQRLLAGTLGGISVLNANAVARNLTATNSGLRHNWITALAPAPRGGWLIGTYGAGIESLSADLTRIAPAELPAGTPPNLVINPNALLVTPTRVFAGTLDHGLLVLDLAANRWSVVTRGLPSLNVTAFAERDGQLYVGTENGLVRIAEARLP